MKKHYEKMTTSPLQVQPESNVMVGGSIQFGTEVKVEAYKEADCTFDDFTVTFD